MRNDSEGKALGKRPGHMKWYFDAWLAGTTRDELTHAERAVYSDLLCMAGHNDPPGQIDLASLGSLAKRLLASQRLVFNTIRKGVQHQKLRIIRVWQDPVTLKKHEDSELTPDQLQSNFTKLSQNGLNLFSIIIIGWNSSQAAYLRGEPYPERASAHTKKAPDRDPNNAPRGEERIEEKRRGE